jgi:formylglycine-generating enzyme required for sulfatase activity
MNMCECTQGRLLIAFVIFCLSLCSVPTFSACPSADLTGDCFVDMDDFSLLAGQWLTVYDSSDLAAMALEWLTAGTPEPDITWVSISETGFTGQMSKYETTNAQYCQFLNAALATGDITVSGSTVFGANGTNNGMDYVGAEYYNLTGAGYGADARINYSGGIFTVDSGFENHPVNYVSRYGATAFCGYYGWRLPTLAEWQAVADYNGTYIYGCGTTINNTKANYNNYVGTTSAVGAFGEYGYGMCDMAGNVFEWTSTDNFNNSYICGGSWNMVANSCKISYLLYIDRSTMAHNTGFRACRVAGIPEPDMTWTSINDYAFAGQISKYETTNAQYCQFLNDALASGDITVGGGTVYGASGSNGGIDFVGSVYYDLEGTGGNADSIVNGGAARIHYSGVFTVDSGFENHPVSYVSRPGAAAFCGYYGWRLPTRLEWQAVADYTGSYTYGCGRNIYNSIANYLGSSHPFGTTAVGTFGIYGYGVCDMAGNVNEWTSTASDADNYSYQGGGWDATASSCLVLTFPLINQYTMTHNLGFRACR